MKNAAFLEWQYWNQSWLTIINLCWRAMKCTSKTIINYSRYIQGKCMCHPEARKLGTTWQNLFSNCVRGVGYLWKAQVYCMPGSWWKNLVYGGMLLSLLLKSKCAFADLNEKRKLLVRVCITEIACMGGKRQVQSCIIL